MIKLRDLPINPPLGVMLRCPDGCCQFSADQRDYDPRVDHEFWSYCEQPLRLVQEVTTYRRWTNPKRFKRHQP